MLVNDTPAGAATLARPQTAPSTLTMVLVALASALPAQVQATPKAVLLAPSS